MNVREIAERVRNIVTERSPAAVNLTIPHIQALIPTALELWTDNIIHTPEAKAQLTVTKTLNLSSGTLDLTAYVDGTSGKIRLDDLKKRTIYTTVGTARVPFTWLASQQQLNHGRYFAASNPAIWLDDKTLRTRNTDGSQTSLGSASVTFEVLETPTATTLPDTLAGSFIAFLADLAVREKVVDG